MRALALRVRTASRVHFQQRQMSGYAFLFPGQGSQKVGMTQELIANVPSVAGIFRTAEQVLGYDLQSLCLRGPQSVLDETVHCQPAVVVASLAALESLKLKQPEVHTNCRAAAGFSVGEFTALIFAEALSLEQGLGLIKLRAEVMQEACKERPSGMLTLVGLEEDKVKQLCLECREKVPYSEICIANYLFPKGYVISGSREDINWIRDPASKLEATVKEVAVSGAFHSNLMKSAVPKLREGLSKVDIAPPKIPVFSNVTGLPYTDAEDIRNHLAEQIIRPVLWEGTVRNMIEKAKEEAGGRRMSEGGEAERRMEREGELTFVEVGPGRQLRAMLKRIDKEAFRKCVNY